MRTLVTGADGFIGSWLTEALAERGDAVVGTTRGPAAGGPGALACEVLDMRDERGIDALVARTRPDRIFHLAAQTSPRLSFTSPAETMETNVTGTVHLLEAVRKHAPGAAVLSVGSSAEYGDTTKAHERVSEGMPLLPTSPYGVSKAAQGKLARVYAMAYGLRVVHVRPFAILGPRKRGDALSEFCSNVAEIELGRKSSLSVGATTSERDFVDVRDAVRALMLILEQGAAGETYNVCHGEVTTLGRVLELLKAQARVPVAVAHDPSRMRLTDDVRIVGDASRLFGLGYRPRHTLEETVAATLEYWRREQGA